MPEITAEEAKIVQTLCDIAWAAGSVRSEKMGDDLKALKAKLSEPEPKKE